MSQGNNSSKHRMSRPRAAVVRLILSAVISLPVMRAQANPIAPPLEMPPRKSAGKATKQPSRATVTKPRTGATVSKQAPIYSSLEGTTWMATVYWFDYSRFGKPPSNRVIEVGKFVFKFLRGGKFEGGVADHTIGINGNWIQKAQSVTVKDRKVNAPWNGQVSKVAATIKGDIMTGRGTRNDNQQFRFKAVKRSG